MKRIKYFVVLTSLLLIILKCKSLQTNADLEKVFNQVENDLGTKYDKAYNTDSSYVICSKRLKSGSPQGFVKTKYVVISLSNGNIIKSGVLNFGELSWVDRYVIRLNSGKGYISDEDNGIVSEYYHVRENRTSTNYKKK